MSDWELSFGMTVKGTSKETNSVLVCGCSTALKRVIHVLDVVNLRFDYRCNEENIDRYSCYSNILLDIDSSECISKSDLKVSVQRLFPERQPSLTIRDVRNVGRKVYVGK